MSFEELECVGQIGDTLYDDSGNQTHPIWQSASRASFGLSSPSGGLSSSFQAQVLCEA